MEHTCQYCDGTLQSVRPVCRMCGHALNLQLYPITNTVSERFLGITFTQKVVIDAYNTTCPECEAINRLDKSMSKVEHAYYM